MNHSTSVDLVITASECHTKQCHKNIHTISHQQAHFPKLRASLFFCQREEGGTTKAIYTEDMTYFHFLADMTYNIDPVCDLDLESQK